MNGRGWKPEVCSRCGQPARVRISVTTLDGDVLWLWSSCVTCEPRAIVPLDSILEAASAETAGGQP